jgi:hypothetical protein
MIPGSGALNAGYAVTYGDLGEANRMNLVRYLDQQNQDRQDKIDAQQQADAAHKFALQKYYGKEFDPSNFDTQTDLNQRLSDMASGSLKRVSDLINSGASDEDIDNAANQELSGIQKTYQVASAVKRNIDTSMEGLQSDKTLAPYLGSLKKQAFINALYTKDPNGKVRLKTDQELSQIDPNQNFAGDILQNNPQLVVPGNIDWNAQLKKFTPKTFKNSGEYYSSPGVKKTGSYEAQYYDGAQKIATDKKGVTSVETANDPIFTKDANGNPVKIDQAPDYVMTALQSTPGEKANMDVATQRWLAQHYPNSPQPAPNTPEFEVAKKNMVYDGLNKLSPKLISSSDKVNESAAKIRLDLGYPMPGSGKGTTIEQDQADVNKSFNSISGVKYYKDSGVGVVPVGNIVNGKADGQVQNGEVLMKLEDLPIAIRNAVAKYSPGNDVSGIVTGRRKVNKEGLLQVELKDGVVSGVMTDKGQWFRATDLTNANIKEQNTTLPMKQKQHYIQGQGGTYQLGGKTITDDMLQKGAKKYGMTVEQYKASIGLK